MLVASCAAPAPTPTIARSEVAASTPPEVAEAPVPKPKSELPRGGRALFPDHRLVGFCGTPWAPALGDLHGNLAVKSKALVTYAEKYAGT